MTDNPMTAPAAPLTPLLTLTESDLEHIRNCDTFAQQGGSAEYLTAERQRGKLLRELDATRAQLAAVTLDNERLREALQGIVDNEHACTCVHHLPECDGKCWHAIALAALSPTQPSPTEGNES